MATKGVIWVLRSGFKIFFSELKSDLVTELVLCAVHILSLPESKNTTVRKRGSCIKAADRPRNGHYFQIFHFAAFCQDASEIQAAPVHKIRQHTRPPCQSFATLRNQFRFKALHLWHTSSPCPETGFVWSDASTNRNSSRTCRPPSEYFITCFRTSHRATEGGRKGEKRMREREWKG